ncbi:MAG: lysine--tRNA ligase [Pyrinomonadaceae bacterium]|nr:lysine--tRNA ligase [Pyrinomonadaceae bacterium]
MNIPAFEDIVEQNDQTAARREHLEKLRGLVGNVYPNKFERSKVSGDEDTISNLVNFAPVVEIVEEIKAHVATLAERMRPNAELKEKLNEKLKALGTVRISGRLAVPPRVMGKAAFVHLSDGVERLQIYCRKEDFVLQKNDSQDSLDSQDSWTAFGFLDHGDFIGVEGYLFLTNTGEMSVHVEKLQFLAKALLPMPDKMRGIVDPELQRRYRYADLIADSLKIDHEENELTTREVFERRAKLISGMRSYLDSHGYIEVETPMLTPKATGASATPFETHHNALDIPLYARIAPELYLKRLTVGGFEKVYELNRNFRNEGLSHKHNPEFTMLEFYCAYMDVNGMMDFCEQMIKESVQKATGNLKVTFDLRFTDFGQEFRLPIIIDFETKFKRLTMIEATIESLDWCPELGGETITKDWFNDPLKLKRLNYALLKLANGGVMQSLRNIEIVAVINKDEIRRNAAIKKEEVWAETLKTITERTLGEVNESSFAKNVTSVFEISAESALIQPTFIVDYPKSISPLSKASLENPNIAERFELFINGMECANGFSELNDPREQYERFVDQMKERESGDAEAMVLDEDYIKALSYGMPPAAGIGIGIDRLVMLLTNKHSIRDVILFPHMRPITKED